MSIERHRIIQCAEFAITHNEIFASTEVNTVLQAFYVSVLHENIFECTNMNTLNQTRKIHLRKITDDQILDIMKCDLTAKSRDTFFTFDRFAVTTDAVADQM